MEAMLGYWWLVAGILSAVANFYLLALLLILPAVHRLDRDRLIRYPDLDIWSYNVGLHPARLIAVGSPWISSLLLAGGESWVFYLIQQGKPGANLYAGAATWCQMLGYGGACLCLLGLLLDCMRVRGEYTGWSASADSSSSAVSVVVSIIQFLLVVALSVAYWAILHVPKWLAVCPNAPCGGLPTFAD